MKKTLEQVMADLYKSEINLCIKTFWDGGWDVKLGDHMNGYVAAKIFYDLNAVSAWLIDNALDHFPGSSFAKKYKGVSPAEPGP